MNKSKPNFEPVAFESSRKSCESPLAVTPRDTVIDFRADKNLAKECGIKKGDLYALFHDSSSGLLALVGDPENKTGEARRFHPGAEKAKDCVFKISFPRRDLLARIWGKPQKISGLDLFKGRAKGKIVFHIPEEVPK